jgi:hypothetical protein
VTQVVSNLERLSGELTEETGLQLTRLIQNLRAAMADTTAAPLGALAATRSHTQPMQLSPELLAQLGAMSGGGGGGTAMQKLRIVILGFGTARQKRVFE